MFPSLHPLVPGGSSARHGRSGPLSIPLSYTTVDACGPPAVPFLNRRLLHTNHFGLGLKLVHADLERLSPDWPALIKAHGRRTGEHARRPRNP